MSKESIPVNTPDFPEVLEVWQDVKQSTVFLTGQRILFLRWDRNYGRIGFQLEFLQRGEGKLKVGGGDDMTRAGAGVVAAMTIRRRRRRKGRWVFHGEYDE